MKLGLHGAGGRMGRAIAKAAVDSGTTIVAAVDRSSSPVLGRDVGELAGSTALGVTVTSSVEALLAADAIIDFSSPAATAALATLLCDRGGRPLAVGTTGLEAAANEALDALSKVAPVLVAPNTSVGVNVLFHLAELATRLLGPAFDAEIVEMHHKHKIDAPSGTAIRLAERVKAGRAEGTRFVHGRSGQVGARKDDEVGVLALRGGDVIGEHTLVLAGPGERLELVHRAHDRSLFARGALVAARFVSTAKPGQYDMADAIGLR